MRMLKLIVFGFLFFLMVGAVTGGGSPERLKDLVRTEWQNPSPTVIEKAARVSGCEAGWSNRVGDGNLVDEKWGPSVGPFQIRTLWSDVTQFGRFVKEPGGRERPNRNPILMAIPSFNAQAAYDISSGGTTWGAWTCGHS